MWLTLDCAFKCLTFFVDYYNVPWLFCGGGFTGRCKKMVFVQTLDNTGIGLTSIGTAPVGPTFPQLSFVYVPTTPLRSSVPPAQVLLADTVIFPSKYQVVLSTA